MKSYYQILEIAPDASQEVIKEQYRFLVQAWHPDKFPNSAQKLRAEEKLKEINAAYEILRNPAKRAEYDSSTRYNNAHSTQEREYREQTDQRQSEDERRKEEAARRAREEQWQKEHIARERAEAKKRRAEDMQKQKVNQLGQEISLLQQEVNKLSKKLPEMPTPIWGVLLCIGGLCIPVFGISGNIIFFLVLGGITVITGIIILVYRDRFYKENYKPVFTEFLKRKRRLRQLVRQRLYLKNKKRSRKNAG